MLAIHIIVSMWVGEPKLRQISIQEDTQSYQSFPVLSWWHMQNPSAAASYEPIQHYIQLDYLIELLWQECLSIHSEIWICCSELLARIATAIPVITSLGDYISLYGYLLCFAEPGWLSLWYLLCFAKSCFAKSIFTVHEFGFIAFHCQQDCHSLFCQLIVSYFCLMSQILFVYLPS